MAVLPGTILELVPIPIGFIAFLTAILSYTILWILYAVTWHPLAKVPGPFWASVTRLWYMYRIFAGDMAEVQRRLHDEYGPLVRIAPDEVSSADPAAIPKIYRNYEPLSKTDFYRTWAAPQISNQPDVFSCLDEDVHARYRKIINPVYSLTNVLKYESYVHKCNSLFLQRMAEFADKGQEVDLSRWLQMYAFDVIGELCFGNMFGFMEKSHDHGHWIAALDELMAVSCVSAVSPAYLRPLIMGSAIVFPPALKALRALHGIRTTAAAVVAQRKKEISEGTVDRVDLLQQLSKIVEDKGDKVSFTDDEVVLEAYVALLAGSDTTTTALRACLYYLMKHPEKLAKCQAEIDAHGSSLSSPIRYVECNAQLPYTCASIKEAMRIFPSIGLSMQRHAPISGIELSGTFIPGGWRVGCNPSVVHYDKGAFGEDADSFRPERWLLSEKKNKEMEKNMLIFGAGTRVCIGKNISLTEIYTLVPELLRTFDFAMAHDRPWKTIDRWFHMQRDMIVKLRQRE